MPATVMTAIWTSGRNGRSAKSAKVTPSTTPADVMTPPVVVRPLTTPSSRIRAVRKML